MRAARFHGKGDVRIEAVASPGEPADSEVLVAPRCCGICGTDLHEYACGPNAVPVVPHPLTGASAPQILGHEFAGEVVAVGAGVRDIRAGDRVAIMPLIYCGRCGLCRSGLEHHCRSLAVTGLSSRWGGLASLALVPDYQLVPLPDALSFEQGALIEPAAVAVAAVDRARARPNDFLLVTGGGPIGALVALYALASGCDVVVSEARSRRAERLAALGFPVIDPTRTDLAAELLELTGGLGVDVAVECAGSAAALSDCIASVRPGGVVVQVGLHAGPVELSARALTRKELRLVGSWCYPVAGFARVARLIASGKLEVERIAGAPIPLDDLVHRGLEALLDPSSDEIKILVDSLG